MCSPLHVGRFSWSRVPSLASKFGVRVSKRRRKASMLYRSGVMACLCVFYRRIRELSVCIFRWLWEICTSRKVLPQWSSGDGSALCRQKSFVTYWFLRDFSQEIWRKIETSWCNARTNLLCYEPMEIILWWGNCKLFLLYLGHRVLSWFCGSSVISLLAIWGIKNAGRSLQSFSAVYLTLIVPDRHWVLSWLPQFEQRCQLSSYCHGQNAAAPEYCGPWKHFDAVLDHEIPPHRWVHSCPDLRVDHFPQMMLRKLTGAISSSAPSSGGTTSSIIELFAEYPD